MTIAVLGATGFLGSWAVRALVAAGADVVAPVRPTSDTWRIDGARGVDIVRSDNWAALVGSLAPEAVLSLDWEGVSKAGRDSAEVQTANVTRITAVARAALDAGTRRFVGVGSQAEYGPFNERISEERRTDPTTPYGRAKVAASQVLAAAADEAGATFVWARVFSVFGPLETGDWLLPSLARAAAADGSLALSSGAQPWSYLFAADAGTALAELVSNPAASGAYNVGHPAAPPLRESVELFAAALRARDTPRFGDLPGTSIVPDTSRLQGLGWEPRWRPEDAFDATARWLLGEAVADPFFVGSSLPPQRST